MKSTPKELPRCIKCNHIVFAGETYCRACRDSPVAPFGKAVEQLHAPGDPSEWTPEAVVPPGLDLVNHPPHYNASSIETIDAIEAALTPEEFRGYIKGNVLKYVWREKHKGGDQDLAKATWYLNRLKPEAPLLPT